MWLLSVDTTSKHASVALLRDSRLIVLIAPRSPEQHSVQLFRILKQALGEVDLNLADLDTFAVTSGPGAFTGLRVGLAAVKGLAEPLGKPVVPVSVLEAVCQAANADGLLAPLVDAYRGQVFGGLYEKTDLGLELRGRERVATMEEFLSQLEGAGIRPETTTLVGPQMDRWADVVKRSFFAESKREQVSPVLAEAVARCAERKLARGETLDALHLEANYVRRSDAELLWKPK